MCALLVGCAAEAGAPAGETGARVAAGAAGHEAPEPAPSAVLWRPVGSWSGSGDRQTESFDVTTGALRLTWQATGESGGAPGHLRVAVHSAISGRPLTGVVDHVGPGADTALVAVSPRVAHLQIDSDHLAWRLTLEERVAQPDPGDDP